MIASRLRLAAGMAALVVGGAVIHGYVVPSPERRWADGTIEVHEQLDGPAGPLLDGSANLNAAFETAVETWNQYLGRIQFVPVRGSTAQIGDGNDVNNVILSDTAFDRPFDENTLAVTTRWYNTRTNRWLEFDVVFNNKWSWNSYRGPLRDGVEDIVRVGLNQVGRAIGLASPDGNGQSVPAIMNATVSNLDTLTFDDIAGALSLYTSADATAPPTQPEQVRQFKVQTDASGLATFAVSAARNVPIQFVDESTGSAIPGADAYLFTDPNGIAVAALSDPLGRYFTQIAPVRLPVTVAASSSALADPPVEVPAASSAVSVRPIEVPVPVVRPTVPEPTPNVITDWISKEVVSPAWNVVRQRAMNLLREAKAGRVVVEREVRLDELTEGEFTKYIEDAGESGLEGFINASGSASASLLWKYFSPINTAVNLRDAFWSATRLALYGQGYGNDQRFTVTVVRVPYDLPKAIRKYTEWQVNVTALEEPKDPWIPKPPGVINGRLIDATNGQGISGLLTLIGPESFLVHPGRNGFFASDPIQPGSYYVTAESRNYRPKTTWIEVKGDGAIENATIALVPVGIRRVVVEPARQTIRDTQVTSFRATAYGADNLSVSPAPRFVWNSDAPSVATIDRETGGVRAVRAGATQITASADQVTSAPAVLTVERTTPCAYTVAPARWTSPVAGGAGTVNVTTDSDCDWSSTSHDSFLSIIAGGRGPGSGTARFSVAGNTAQASRTGRMTIAGTIVTVVQSGTCSYGLSPTAVSVPAAGGSGSITVTTDADCSWDVSSSSFITVGRSSGSGPGTVTYSVGANTGAARSGSITIGGQTVTVSQLAAAASGTSVTGSIQCTRGTRGSGTFNSLTCTGAVTVILGTGFRSGTNYLALFWPPGNTDASLRTSSFTAAAAGSRYQLTVTGSSYLLAPSQPACPPTQTSAGFYVVGAVTGSPVVSATVSIPVSCR